MAIAKEEAKQLVERLIFGEESPKTWAQDVWDMSPTLGETAARLAEVLDQLIDYCSEDQLEVFLQSIYREQIDHN